MDDDKTLKIFQTIVKFVTSLNECFGSNQKSLQLYCRLLRRTTIVHEDAIKKHIDIFKKFVEDNNENILSKNINFKNDTLKYSDRVYINMQNICKKADKDNLDVIWKYLLTLSALLNPKSNAKEQLKKKKEAVEKLKEGTQDGSNESKFINDLMSTVENNVDTDNDNPMAAVSSMMGSGVLTGLMGNMNDGLKSGDLDMGKLIGSVQGMVGNLNNEMKSQPGYEDNHEMSQMMNHMNGMMSMMSQMTAGLSNKAQESDSAPDIKQLE